MSISGWVNLFAPHRGIYNVTASAPTQHPAPRCIRNCLSFVYPQVCPRYKRRRANLDSRRGN
jgi:hypothetical protein